MFPLMLLGPALAGIILTGRAEGKTGLRNLFSRIGRWRAGVRWYAAALLIPPVMISVVLLLLSTLVSPIYTPNRFLVGFLFGIAAAFFEEIGWTGYAFPKLRLTHKALPAALLLGLLWGLWHFPVVDFLGAASPHGSFLPAFFIAFILLMTAMRVLIAWIYTRTSSLLLPMIMHASSTGCLAALGPARLSPAQEACWYAVYAAALWILVIILAARQGFSRAPAPGQAACNQ